MIAKIDISVCLSLLFGKLKPVFSRLTSCYDCCNLLQSTIFPLLKVILRENPSIPILACKQCIFLCFKVYKFSLGLCLNNQVKEKQCKCSIVIPYDVYQLQGPPKLPKNAVQWS